MATSSDLDSITDLGLASLPDDPIWPYRFPNAKKYANEHYKYSRMRFAEYLGSEKDSLFAIMLAELHDEKPEWLPKVVAMAIWQLPGTHLTKLHSEENSGCEGHLLWRMIYSRSTQAQENLPTDMNDLIAIRRE
jgi:hypothetical protein